MLTEYNHDYMAYPALTAQKVMSQPSPTASQSRPYIDLSRVTLPTQIRIDDRELDVSSLNDQQKLILLDLARLDKEINDTEFSLRVLRSAKSELSRLFSKVTQAPNNESNGN
jgi:hypothetical protein